MRAIEGSYVLGFRYWLATVIMPRRPLRLLARSLEHLSYEEQWHCYWDDKHWADAAIDEAIRRQEVYDVLGPPRPTQEPDHD